MTSLPEVLALVLKVTVRVGLSNPNSGWTAPAQRTACRLERVFTRLWALVSSNFPSPLASVHFLSLFRSIE